MKNLLYIYVIFVLATGCGAQTHDQLIEENAVIDTNKVIEPSIQHSREARIIATIFTRYHYKKVQLNDSLSQVVFNNFLNSLDRNKLYFYKKDFEEFEKYKTELDDDIRSGNLEPFYNIFNLYKKRLGERVKFAIERLAQGFDFTKDEYFYPDRKDSSFASTEKELNELWRKRLKNDALNLKLSGKEWDNIVETLSNRYKRFHKTILQYKAEDVFQLAMNAYANSIDPHSNYFSPITSENFKINMSLSFEGIGAQLTTENDYTKVARIIPGGPAFKDGNLKEEDKIIGVGQGEEGEIVDVIGWRIDDVVQLIRGKKGTIVRLQIIRGDVMAGGETDTITIVRDKVKLEEQAAKSEILDLDHNGKKYRIGIIDLPAFYIDFEARRKGDPDYKSTTKDVRKLIAELKKEGIDGLVIDLRYNGGGSLQEAIDLTGLFIESGPVVQVRNSNGKIDVDKDTDPELYYDGPLVVLVNRYSASASEIFSGAIQDYGRGIVVGEQTYGKGTVQNLIDLERFMPSGGKLGQVKLTIAKFYRITGSSTQNLGVIPDIEYPSPVPPEEFGESANPSSLKWDRIAPTQFKKYDNLQTLVPKLIAMHNDRIAHEKKFQYLLEDIEYARKMREKKSYSLNEKIRKKEREEREALKKKREESQAGNTNLELKGDEEVSPHDKIVDDVELNETSHILADLIILKTG